MVASWPNLNPEQLRLLALAAREQLGRGLVVLGSTIAGKGSLVGVASKDLVEEGISAAEVVASGAKLLGGGGSRDPELAQAGGPNGHQLDAALDAAREAADGPSQWRLRERARVGEECWVWTTGPGGSEWRCPTH